MTFACVVYNFLNTWQTLIGSVLAVIAAVVTIWEMRRQSRGDETRHQNDLARKKMAARSQMPDALSEMTVYVRASAAHLVVGAAKPLPPIAALNTLKAVIEHIDTREAEKTFELVSWYQVQQARLAGSDHPNALEVNDMLFDAALLQAHINRLFDYARNTKEDPRPENLTREDLLGGLKNALTLQVWAARHGEFGPVELIINRRYKPAAQTE